VALPRHASYTHNGIGEEVSTTPQGAGGLRASREYALLQGYGNIYISNKRKERIYHHSKKSAGPKALRGHGSLFCFRHNSVVASQKTASLFLHSCELRSRRANPQVPRTGHWPYAVAFHDSVSSFGPASFCEQVSAKK